ncbi:MAG: AsnC family transcriptional regulator [Armatimonadetes bacterium]|jgi:DNA-binding Lrp family transcriptional regulator|nr:AsnC family transcriptional regulator [Armatimonadota bacterium]
MDSFDARLLEAAQEGLPLVPRPFKALAERLGASEREVIDALDRLQREGIIRELSAFLDPRSMGYHSTLACLRVPPERVDEVAALLAAMPEVTHNYLRDHEYNMWFTLIAPSEEEIGEQLATIADRAGCGPIHNLPAEKVYKIRVAFRADEMAP